MEDSTVEKLVEIRIQDYLFVIMMRIEGICSKISFLDVSEISFNDNLALPRQNGNRVVSVFEALYKNQKG